ncbi:MAG TPA: GDSL-type esterase/lipase family protein [Verrucomicrobiae bacterium]
MKRSCVNFLAALLAAVFFIATAGAAPVKVAILGDSTVSEYPTNSIIRGWGHYVQSWFNDSLQVTNVALSGRSSKSFITEGHWEKTKAIRPDIVIIQFGHNDSHAKTEPKATDAATDYRDYLHRYINEARAFGAQVVLVTPMHRRTFNADGSLNDILKPYAEAMKIVAADKKVPLVDLHTASGKLFAKLGDAGSADLSNAPGDRTHFSAKGARAMAELVMQELPQALPTLKQHLKAKAPEALTADELVPGKISKWNGFNLHEIEFEKRKAYIVVPEKAAEGRPWIWRARFWAHRPEVDIALLGKGFHLVYIDAPELIGSPAAVEVWNKFYAYLTTIHRLNAKPALEGMSRGGLYIYNWASANPEKVACIYADAPVCTFQSWPGGKGKSKGSPKDWELVLKAYGFKDEAEAMAWKGNPIDSLAPLAKAKVPLLHVVGDADEVVPVDENTAIIEQRYKELGGSIQVIHKPGIGHVHGLDDPKPIVDFILANTLPRKVVK